MLEIHSISALQKALREQQGIFLAWMEDEFPPVQVFINPQKIEYFYPLVEEEEGKDNTEETEIRVIAYQPGGGKIFDTVHLTEGGEIWIPMGMDPQQYAMISRLGLILTDHPGR